MNAIVSDCGLYRYTLERTVGMEGIVILYCGVNSSTAGPTIDDHTSAKWIGFTKLHGGRSYIAINPFAYRTAKVVELALQDDPIGPDNDRHIQAAIDRADWLVPCWGNRTKVPQRLRYRFEHVEQMFRASGKPVKVFGLTKSGDPLHPLRLSYDTKLVAWERS